MKRFVCIHGHFYQPPRENPGLDAVERQDSAAPYHDWNERITRECYAPNAAARILDDDDRIARIVNNYARMSYNFGPTLLTWLERREPEVHAAVVAADGESRERFSGHGSAMAQAYNHAILPLCNERDRRTQVAWGIADFRHRFGRAPEGMWLAETAVDTASLEELAGAGIAFTVLAPRQAARVRPPDAEWTDVAETGIDPRRAYRVDLPSGRSIAVFFYDGPISQAIAFERLLNSGATFESRLMSGFDDRDEPQLVHVGTDGETYGHHHRFGEMALAHAIELIDARDDVELTNYGEFLERFPPTHQVEIVEQSSWSCAHGVERWRADCGCNSGTPGFTQAWRGPLRDALDELRDGVAPRFAREVGRLLEDPWDARDDYISVVLDRGPASREAFFARHQVRPLSSAERVVALRLLEQQRHAMNMFTSCGWFFDDIAGIEPVQILRYADRVLQIDEELLGGGLREPFLARLAEAPGNRPGLGDGRRVFDRYVTPGRVDHRRVAAHAAVRALFDGGEVGTVHCYDVEAEETERNESGRTSLLASRLTVRSRLTGEEERFSCIVAHFGDHALNVLAELDHGDHARALAAVREPFQRGDVARVVRALDEHSSGDTLSLRALFRDEQRRIVARLVHEREEAAGDALRRMYADFRPLLRVLTDLDVPVPEPFVPAAAFAIRGALRGALVDRDPGAEEVVAGLLEEAESHGVSLDDGELGHALRLAIERAARRFRRRPDDVETLAALVRYARRARELPFGVDLWEVQNLCWRMAQDERPTWSARAAEGDAAAAAWMREFTEWCRLLDVVIL